MARTKSYVTPECRKLVINLNKRQLKEFKKMSIEFEVSLDELLQISVDVFIHKYQTLSPEEIDRKGIEAMML